MPQLSFSPVGNQWLVLCMALALLGLLVWGPLGSNTTPRRRAALVGLRLVVFLLVILAMLRPTLVYTETQQQQATLVLLVDQSRSMQVADSFGNKTRWETLRTALTDATPALKDLAKDLEVKIYAFDADAHEVKFTADTEAITLPDKPEGEQTAIGWVLEEVLRRETGKRLAGVILLSDGAVRAYSPRDVPPQAPVGRLRDLGYELYTLAFGQSRGLGQARDVAMRDLVANQTVFVKNELAAGGRVRIEGFVDQQVPVQLLFEMRPGQMEVVETRPVQASKDGQEVALELSYVPQTAGEYKLTLKALPQPGELVTTNNELSTFVTVLDGGLNVLYLEGTARPEMKYLRRSLDASPDIQVDFHRIDAERPETRPADMADWFQPGKFNVYILGDLDVSAFKPQELKDLAEAVSRGAGLIMLGGMHSFAPGGYAGTPVGDLLPVELNKLERQRFGDTLRQDAHLPGPLKLKPAATAGSASFVVRLTTDDNRAAWEQLPPLEGANKLGELKPAAHMLLETPNNRPMLVAQEAGNGRVLAFAGDSTWHWVMQGHGDWHKRFWRQVVLWLARQDESQSGDVWIKLDQRRFQPGGRVEFSAGARTPEGEPVANAQLQAEIVLPDESRRPISMSRQEDHWVGSFFETQAAGDYTIAVTARNGSESLGEAKARFLVDEQDLELDNAVAERGVLDSLAAMTGGKSLAPEQLPALLEELKKVPEQLQIETLTKQPLWDQWPLFVLLVVLLGSEWFLRKRWGLV
jgi:hypothetical protein